jgi:hypothetical protein
MPHHALTERDTFEFITNDFESAWDCLASLPGAEVGRGNFLFALQATILLEWASRLCASDTKALHDFAGALNSVEPRYFLNMPAESPNMPRFELPNLGAQKTQLLTFIFDLVRNGQSHRYQQISAALSDGSIFAIALSGAHHGKFLERLNKEAVASEHLTLRLQDRVAWLIVDAAMLYCDIKRAIEAARLLSRGLTLPSDFDRAYSFTREQLQAAFQLDTS